MDALIIGGGPAGLMAAERLLAAGRRVVLCEAGPVCGRKLLVAGRGGLNLGNADPDPAAACRSGPDGSSIPQVVERLRRWLAAFDCQALQRWCRGLGIEVYPGNGGRRYVRPGAKVLLRAWLARLRGAGLEIRSRWRLVDRIDDAWVFRHATGTTPLIAPLTILACGGGSWPRTGSDGAWTTLLEHSGLRVTPLRPANCGIDLDLPTAVLARHAGVPLTPAVLSHDGRLSHGNLVSTATGLEGGAVYRLVPDLRAALARGGTAVLHLDCAPERAVADLAARLARPRGKRSFATHLQKTCRVAPQVVTLLRAVVPDPGCLDPVALAALLKALPLPVRALRPLAEAISTAGGLALDEVDEDLRLRRLPDVFAVGEMLDWEAPTGGYLIPICLAQGWTAGTAAAVATC